MRHPIAAPANPGASSTAVIFDDGAANAADQSRGTTGRSRCRAAFYTNVADAVFNVEWAAPGSSNLRSVASVAIGAATYFQRDTLLQPGRTRITIATTTNPTTWELGAEIIDDHALGQ